MSNFNNQLQTYLAQHRIDDFRLVRYVYLLHDTADRFLLVKAITDNFPVQMFGECWQILSDSYYACDMLDADVLETAREVIQQFTNLSALDLLLAQVLPGGDYPKFGKYLALFFYAHVEDGAAFEFWSDYHTEALWLPREAALAQVEVAEDRQFLANLRLPVMSLF
ncbi:MAG: hypothetical protein JW892_01175 [Anaerolineae bacterium]|nr:hypothetical protein [Anaerolineae bacterium]